MSNSFDIHAISIPVLEQYRLRTDPEADRTIAAVIEAGYERQINQVFMTIVQNEQFDRATFTPLGDEIGEILYDYFDRTRHLPDWADPQLIQQGEEVFASYGPEIFMLLNVSSLPLCYTCAKGAQVLYETGRLLSHRESIDPLARRLMETAQMVVNVMSPGGLAAGGQGIVTIQKVRLIHASIRYFLKHRKDKEDWNVEEFGEPINQEDLCGTLMSFGPVILSGLAKLKVHLKEKEQLAYMHAWKVVGYLMGIEEPLLPDTFEEGFELAAKILNHQSEPSEAGQALTNSCIQFVNHIIPGHLFNDLPAFYMHTFLEDYSTAAGVDLDACIGLSHDHNLAEEMAMKLTRSLIGTISDLEQNDFIHSVAKPFNKVLLEGIIKFYDQGRDVRFFIPPSLRKNWQLNEN